MDLSNLKATEGSVTKRTRVGRGEGSGLGKTCGRGHKGQKSRSGGTSARGKEGGQMPLYRRLPKRGFNNKMFQEKICIVNTGRLNIFEDGAKVNAVELYAKGLISNRNLKVKVLGKGTLERKLEVSANFFSKSAKEQIEKAGGTVNVESMASK